MDSGNLFDIRALAALLKENDSDGESDSETTRSDYINPGLIGTSSLLQKSSTPEHTKNKNARLENKDHPDSSSDQAEASSGNFKIPDFSNDPRTRPEVKVQFQQKVSTEDVYLGTFNATPSSASCSWLIVKIEMPGESDSSDFQLDLKENWIELQSPMYALVYVLPHRINPRAGNAKWNRETDTLTLTLKIIRDLDAFNQGLY